MFPHRLKSHISFFFLTLLVLGMADFSLHSLSHDHNAENSQEITCSHDHSFPDVAEIFASGEECLLCGQFIVHNAFAIADLVIVHNQRFALFQNLFLSPKLISSPVSALFLRGPPQE